MHRLDRISAKKPAKLLDSKSLTLGFSRKQIWPVFLPHPYMRPADLDRGRFATITPPKNECLECRRPGRLLYFRLAPIKPEQRLALPNAQP